MDERKPDAESRLTDSQHAHIRPARRVAINEAGDRVGETHPGARHPDALVNKLRDLHENYGYGYRRLARQFELSFTTVKKWLRYERRAQTPVEWREHKP